MYIIGMIFFGETMNIEHSLLNPLAGGLLAIGILFIGLAVFNIQKLNKIS